jgi:hypothetical protein
MTNPVEGVLYPSDHFGLEATFHNSKTGFIPQKTIYKKEFNKLAPWTTGYRTDSQIGLMNNVSLVTLIALIFFSVLFLYQGYKTLRKRYTQN